MATRTRYIVGFTLLSVLAAFLLPAMVLIYVVTGSLDFANSISTGIFTAGVSSTIVTILYA